MTVRPAAPSPALQEVERAPVRRHRYRAVRWPLRLVALAVLTGLAIALGLAWRAAQQPSYVQLPVPVLGHDAPVAVPSAPTVPTPASPSAAAAAAAAAAPTTAAPVAVAPSRAVQIYVPSADPDLVISSSVQPLGGCRSVIDPPRNGPGWAGVFGCTDFGQPGSAAPNLAVLAGHSSASLDTVFNKLYRQGSELEQQLVYLRTQDSGDRWLAYRVEHTYVPAKDRLPYMTSVWGGDGSSTAGRLVLVTCQQSDSGGESTANYVAVAQFVGVV